MSTSWERKRKCTSTEAARSDASNTFKTILISLCSKKLDTKMVSTFFILYRPNVAIC